MLLSKSKLLAYRQCPRRLWLEIHRPELRNDSPDSLARMRAGREVGLVARQVYDPHGTAAVIDVEADGFCRALTRSAELLAECRMPVFEAGIMANGILVFGDALLPATEGGKAGWKLIEVKSSTSVKANHKDDVAIQSFVALAAGVPLKSVILAHIDKSWIYSGNGDYRGLLTEHNLTEEAFGRQDEVRGWIGQARKIATQPVEPSIEPGRHCYDPIECGFCHHCASRLAEPLCPVRWLPSLTPAQRQDLQTGGIKEMQDAPDAILSPRQLVVKKHTVAQSAFFDAEGAASDLAAYDLPACFLDFETVQFAVPIWEGTRPYQQIPFQFSLHCLDENGCLSHTDFLDTSGCDPSGSLAKALVSACGEKGPIYVYNDGFEKSRIAEMGQRYPDLARQLLAINGRIVNLLPVARNRYYHPSQRGSWSIKAVMPAVDPEINYARLEGVRDGTTAMEAFCEAIRSDTDAGRKREIRTQLLAYCRLDTYALVRLWHFFGSQGLPAPQPDLRLA